MCHPERFLCIVHWSGVLHSPAGQARSTEEVAQKRWQLRRLQCKPAVGLQRGCAVGADDPPWCGRGLSIDDCGLSIWGGEVIRVRRSVFGGTGWQFSDAQSGCIDGG